VPAPLNQPVILDIENLASTQLLLRLQPILNAKSYQVQTAPAANGPWTEAGIYTQARRIVLLGLTPGTIYFVRVRAIGGSTGYSEWSVPVSLMCTY
jgi:Fibronectin type III domain